MQAQAQECAWQWAVMGMITGLVLIRLFRPPIPARSSNGTIAKLAAQVGHHTSLLCAPYRFFRSPFFTTMPDR